jgi:alpha-D-xyloside xylohydrolase
MKSSRLLLFLFAVSLTARTVSFAMPHRSFPIESFVRDTRGVTFRSSSGAIRIDVCSDRVIHVVASPTSSIPKAIVPVVTETWTPTPFQMTEDAATFHLDTKAMRVDVEKSTGAVTFLDASGKVLLAEPANGGKSFEPEEILGTKTWKVDQSFLSPPDEALYGLGQHQEGWFDMRGIPVRLEQENTNISIPFLLSTRGYGLLWNNASVTDYDPAEQAVPLDLATGKGHFRATTGGYYGFLLTSDGTQQLELTVNGHSVIDLHTMWTPYSAGARIPLESGTEYTVVARGGKTGAKLFFRPPSATTEFLSEAGGAIDYYFFYGGKPDAAIALYRKAIGEAPLFPRWAYGFWQCRERYSSQQQILDVAAEFRQRHIPVDVMVQDWHYWGKYGWNALRFDESEYPDPASMLNTLHRENLHFVISVWPKFGTNTEIDKELHKQVDMIPGVGGAPEEWLDAFNPKAQKLFWQGMDARLFKAGVDGWWLDASEPEGDPLHNVRTFLGPGNLVQNAYPLYETAAVYNGQRSTTEKKRVVILTRSAFAGQQRNAAASWSGDVSGNWETLKRQIPAGLNFSMSGLPYWTTDVGGFFRPKDQYTSSAYHELLIRWFEYGAFCPIFRIHGYQSQTEMWKFGPRVYDILRKYDNLRYRLLPYIYSVAWGVTDQGESMMRALPLEYPEDTKAWNVADEFLFGPALLISPVVEPGAVTRQVYLPEGSRWVDFWTGTSMAGGETATANAPLDHMPIYVKAGSIIPFGPVVQSAEAKADPIDLRIYGGMDADFTLYEDKGDGYDYEKDQRSTIQMHWDNRRHRLFIASRTGSFQGMLTRRTFRVFYVAAGHASGITPDTKPDAIVAYSGKQVYVQLQ